MIINLKKQINNVANNMTSIYDGINLLYIDKTSGYFNKLNFEYEIEKIEKSKYNWFFICKGIVYMDSDKFYDLKSNKFVYHYYLKEEDEFLQPISCFGKTILLSLINEKTEKKLDTFSFLLMNLKFIN